MNVSLKISLPTALISICLIGCAHQVAPREASTPALSTTSAGAPALYREAQSELEAGKFASALQKFDRFIQQNPANRYSQAANLNAGIALEGLKSWSSAADRYHQVINSTGSEPRLQATAINRLSYAHEAMGDDTQVIADLTDLLRRKRFLAQETAEGEMPARLAAAYARVGNFDKAQAYYKIAEIGIARLRQKTNGMPEWLPRTLLLMGETSRRQLSWTDFETFVRPLGRSQVYLLEAAESNQAPWSEKAADELISIYQDLLTTIEAAAPAQGDPVLAKRAIQQKQWSRTGLIVEALADLRARALPENADVPSVSRIAKSLKEIDARIVKLLEERPAGEGVTPSSLARRESRQLRTEPTTDSLEQAFLKSSRDSKPAYVPAPSAPPETGSTAVPVDAPMPIRSERGSVETATPEAAPATSSGDPNL